LARLLVILNFLGLLVLHEIYDQDGVVFSEYEVFVLLVLNDVGLVNTPPFRLLDCGVAAPSHRDLVLDLFIIQHVRPV